MVVVVTVENGYGGREEVEALMYVCPTTLAKEVLLQPLREWSYPEFLPELRRLIEEVIKPCRAQFDKDEEAAVAAAAAAAAESKKPPLETVEEDSPKAVTEA